MQVCLPETNCLKNDRTCPPARAGTESRTTRLKKNLRHYFYVIKHGGNIFVIHVAILQKYLYNFVV